jgi:hypothetical protein
MLQAAGGNTDLASMMLATAISENGSIGKGGEFWANNFFGIKGKGPSGKSVGAVTWEDYGHGPVTITDQFAVFDSVVEGMGGFMWFLKNNSRYRAALEAFAGSGDAIKLFRGVHAAGYATDPIWVDKLLSIRANSVKPITGYARGGMIREPILGVGASGQRYLFGEGGPEYIVPAGAGAGAMQTVRLDVAIGGRIAEEIYVTGRDLALRRGRSTAGAGAPGNVLAGAFP